MTSQAESLVTSYRPDFASLVPPIRPLPKRNEPQVPVYPGQMEGSTFVRRTPVVDPQATRAVFVHGMGGSSNNWTDLMYLLEPTFPGIALDLPGYGFSDPTPDNKYGVGRNAKAVVELLKSEGGKPVHLFGNSLGGITSAARHPELVKSLTLISPAMLTRAVMVKAHAPKALKIATAKRKSEKLGAQAFAEQQADELMALCYADPKRLPPERREAVIAEIQRRTALPYNSDIAAASARALFDAAALEKGKSIWRLARHVEARRGSLQERPGHDLARLWSLRPDGASGTDGSDVLSVARCVGCRIGLRTNVKSVSRGGGVAANRNRTQ